jgi:hypothetical protein
MRYSRPLPPVEDARRFARRLWGAAYVVVFALLIGKLGGCAGLPGDSGSTDTPDGGTLSLHPSCKKLGEMCEGWTCSTQTPNQEGVCAIDCRANLGCTTAAVRQCVSECFHRQVWECSDHDFRWLSSFCDGVIDCSDGSDEAGCRMVGCDNGTTVVASAFCNGVPQCIDGSDEKNCSFPCLDGKSIPVARFCDGTMDCADGSDETEERELEQHRCRHYQCADTMQTVPARWLCDGVADCCSTDCQTPNLGPFLTWDEDCRQCGNGDGAVPAGLLCNSFPDCPDGSDEVGCPAG